jgi:D-beta-D-heptose 7-phosphate kinase/D-beta-D-heptose 1-phosphate adenosyltransferase
MLKKNHKILLLGDSCIDEYQYGVVDRISPEAPVPVFRFEYKETKPGMAANVLENFKALECHVNFITGSSSKKTRLIDLRSHQHIVRIDQDVQSDPIEFGNMLPMDYDAIVISDYNKGTVSYELVEKISKNYKGPVFIDTKKTDLARFNRCFIKINELEYKNRKTDGQNIIVTLGSKGAMYKTKQHEQLFSTKVEDVTDVCGAGDTFLAALVYRYLESKDILMSIEFANQAASVTVQHIGVYAPKLDEIL